MPSRLLIPDFGPKYKISIKIKERKAVLIPVGEDVCSKPECTRIHLQL